MVKQLRWWRGDDGTAANGKQQSTNEQRRTSNNGRMRWRMAAVEETRRMEKQQRRGNGQATTVAGRGATRVLTGMTGMTTKQQSTNVRRQRWRMMTTGKRWDAVVEAEEQLLCNGGEETASR
jgi:hypothetical protein